MAIKAAPITASKEELLDVDPDGESWVYIKPRSLLTDRMRGRLLSQQEFSSDGRYVKVDVNPVELSMWEMWVACGNEDDDIGQIVVEREVVDEEGKSSVKREIYFADLKKTDITYPRFVEELAKCPPSVRGSWVGKVHEKIPEWIFPF